MTAYYAAPLAESVTVLERTRVGDPGTASYALTRSVRQDYLDPVYAGLAAEARRLWLELQVSCGQRLLVDCGCLNLASARVTPDLSGTYGARTFEVLAGLGLRCEAFGAAQLAARYPQFTADAGWLDIDAGYADVAVVTRELTSALRRRGVTVTEGAEVRSVRRDAGSWQVVTTSGTVAADAVVITAGLNTNGLLDLLPDCPVRFPLQPDRPIPWYNLACSYAVLGMTDPAVAALQRALELGYRYFEHLRRDPDLKSLRHDPRFIRLLRKF